MSARSPGSTLVHLLERPRLGREVAVLARPVRVLDMEEEEVEVPPPASDALDLLAEGLTAVDDLHAGQAGGPPVEGIAGEAAGNEAVELRERRQVRQGREATEEEAVGAGLAPERLGHRPERRLQPLDGAAGSRVLRVAGLERDRPLPHLLGVGVGDRRRQVRSFDEQHEAVALSGVDRDPEVAEAALPPGRLERPVEPGDDPAALLGRKPARTAVADPTVGVEGGEVAAGDDVARAEVDAHAERLERSPPDVRLLRGRVVAEQRQVPRPAPGGHSRSDRDDPPERAAGRERVEVRDSGRFEGGPGLIAGPQVPQPVEHQEHDLALPRLGDPRKQLDSVHVERAGAGASPSPRTGGDGGRGGERVVP
jgi:hypothetical protein